MRHKHTRSKTKQAADKPLLATSVSMTPSSGNVFEDIGFTQPIAESLMQRSRLTSEIINEVRRRQWTQKQAAELLGITQPRVSDLMTGQIDKFSVDTLMDYLRKFGLSVNLDVQEPSALFEDECNKYLQEGMNYLNSNQNTLAIKSFERAVSYAEGLDMPELRGDCYYLLGGALACSKKNQAVEIFEKAAAVYSKIREFRKYHLTLNALGMAYANQSRLDEATRVLELALDVAEQQLPVGAVNITNNLIWLGVVFDRQHKYADSERIARRLLTLDKQKYGENSYKLIPIYEVLLGLLKKQKKMQETKRINEIIQSLKQWHTDRAFELIEMPFALSIKDTWNTLPYRDRNAK
jgi:Uncharacterized conserved small protein